jgi:cytochrome P450
MLDDPRGRTFFSPELGMWVVSGYDDVVAILKNHRVFSSERMYETAAEFLELGAEARATLSAIVPLDTPHMANVDPPDHTRLRRAASAWFTPERVAALEPRVRRSADLLTDRFHQLGATDLVTAFTRPLPMMSILDVIGVPPADMERLARYYDDWARLLFTRSGPAEQLAYSRSLRSLHQYFADLIAARRADPAADLTSALVRAVDSGETSMSSAELANLLAQLLAAASDTTTYSLNTCFHHLLQQRRMWDALCAGELAAERIVEEGLRCNRSLRGPLRVATEEVTVGGQTIPKGGRVYLLHTAANRDPGVFPDPHSFDPDRKEVQRQLAFGYGIHYCLGAALARLEMKVALLTLSARLPTLRLAPQPLDYRGTVVRAMTRLEVVWDGAGQ